MNIKYASFRASFSVGPLSPKVAEKSLGVMAPSLMPFCSAFFIDEISDICLSICWAIRSYVLPIDGCPRILRFFHRQIFRHGSALKPIFDEFSLPLLKDMAWEKASNLCQLIEYGRQSEARNFETAQHIDKRLSCVSSKLNGLQKGTKLRAITPRGFSAT